MITVQWQSPCHFATAQSPCVKMIKRDGPMSSYPHSFCFRYQQRVQKMVREFCYLVSKDRIVGLVLAASLIHTGAYSHTHIHTHTHNTHTHTHTHTRKHTQIWIQRIDKSNQVILLKYTLQTQKKTWVAFFRPNFCWPLTFLVSEKANLSNMDIFKDHMKDNLMLINI